MGKYPNEKTPELYAAKRALTAYFKEHNLDPTDQSLMVDPVHGRTITDLVNRLNKERDKVIANYPAADRSNNLKLLKMSKEIKKAKKAKKNQVVETPVVKEAKKEKKSSGRTSTKYDYPQVKDEKTGKMRDMNSDEKKKYRVEARRKASGKTPIKKEAPVVNEGKKNIKAVDKKDNKKKKNKKKEED